MTNKYELYGADCESTGLSSTKNDIIELSLYRLSDDVQKTWLIKPADLATIDDGALRVNGHKREDIEWRTQYGRDNYKPAQEVIIEIENFLAEDGVPAENRCLVGHNVNFDKAMMEQMWSKCGASDSFPFGRRVLDTMILELAMDHAQNDYAEGYSLKNLSKKYAVKNEKAHSAAADTKCTVEIFRRQTNFLSSLIKNAKNAGLI